MRLVLVLPPLTQLNTPYPSTAFLARALRDAGRTCTQRDLGLELVLGLYTRDGLREVFDTLSAREELPEPAWRALALRDHHERCIDPVIRFLQGRDRTLATRILDTPFLPGGPRLDRADLARFGPLASDDAARHLATLYLEDLADLLTACIDPGFAFARYQHHLAAGSASFDGLAERLATTHLIDARIDALADSLLGEGPPAETIVGLSVPFPGNLYGALRIGQRVRARGAFVLLGGGYVNTELRETTEPRLWECVDALTFDDGEGPLLAWLDYLEGRGDRRHRTLTREGRVEHPHVDQPAAFAPDYGGLPLDRYLQVVDTLNPAHRLWSDGRWNKLMVAHGCYWRRCSFCDIQLDYIARYAPTRTRALVDAMEELTTNTGQSGFHLVDEAAPPRGIRDLALEILSRGTAVTWWGNIRFERAWTPDLARLCAASGLVAVTGGLEVASDRLLNRMDKGVTIAQAALAAQAFQSAGVMVHAYLMYGFPTESAQETIDAMEVVRQLFTAGLLDSAFWHRFVLTRHSGMARDPAAYGIQVAPSPPGAFAQNDLDHLDPTGADPDPFDAGLAAALAAWMRGEDHERPVHTWFKDAAPTTIAADHILQILNEGPSTPVGPSGRLVWLGGEVLDQDGALALHAAGGVTLIRGRRAARDWLAEVIMATRPNQAPLREEEVLATFPGDFEAFRGTWHRVRQAGLVTV